MSEPTRSVGLVGVERARLVDEFLALNRRRLEGHPPLSQQQMGRWYELRALLERSLGVVPPPDAEGRRRSLRVPLRLAVRYSDGLADCEGTSVDLSEGGMCLATARSLRPRTPLRIAIERRVGETPLEAGGVVVWARTAPSGEASRVGIRFENLSSDQERAIVALVENALARL